MATPTFARGEDHIEAMATGQAPQQQRGGGVPRFFIHKVLCKDKTVKEIECVEITIPGDLKSRPVNKVTQREIDRFPQEYEAFKSGTTMEETGTRLELFIGKDDPRVADLKHHKITTVEILADMSDTHVQNLGMGYMELRDQAKVYIAQRSGPEALQEQNKALTARLDEMQERMDAMAAASPSAVGTTNEGVDGAEGEGDGPAAGVGEPQATSSEDGGNTETPGATATHGYTVNRGFAGKYVVAGADGAAVFEATGEGAKAQCEEWVKANG